MTAPQADARDMAAVKSRLDQIVEAVSDDALPLDDALTLYEEAVKLGMRASELMESDLAGTVPESEQGQGGEEAAPDGSGVSGGAGDGGR